MGKDYYGALELRRDATDADIKKAYRLLALENHPQKCREPGARERFRLLAEAYDVLSHPVRRGIYDRFGEEGLKGGIPVESGGEDAWTAGYVFHNNPDKVFKEFFGGYNPFAEFFTKDGSEVTLPFGGLRGRGAVKQDPPMVWDLHVSLEDLFFGCTKKMKISRRVMNEDGQTSTIRDKILIIDVQPGWKPGTRVTFEKEGDQGPNVIPADITFVVQEKPHPRFKRTDDDLIYVTDIPLGKPHVLQGGAGGGDASAPGPAAQGRPPHPLQHLLPQEPHARQESAPEERPADIGASNQQGSQCCEGVSGLNPFDKTQIAEEKPARIINQEEKKNNLTLPVIKTRQRNLECCWDRPHGGHLFEASVRNNRARFVPHSFPLSLSLCHREAPQFPTGKPPQPPPFLAPPRTPPSSSRWSLVGPTLGPPHPLVASRTSLWFSVLPSGAGALRVVLSRPAWPRAAAARRR